MSQHPSHSPVALPDALLDKLVVELDDETVRAIILRGSYARGDAVPPYSDVDLVRIVQEMPDRTHQKQYIWREGYLISISTRTISAYRERLAKPERAFLDVAGVLKSCILVDKDGDFSKLQQEVKEFQWESLQAAANTHASQLMVEHTEVVLPTLKALVLHDATALSDMILDLISALTEAFAVQRGVLVMKGSTYFHEVQAMAGLDSAWTHYHRCAAGIDPDTIPSIENRSIAALRLYQETARLVQPYLHPDHWEAIEPVLSMIEQELSHKEIS
jgi:predicted nucleotidyltransferase